MSDTCIDALPDNTSLAIEIEGEKVLVCNSNGRHYAIRNQCTHQNAPLEKGRVRNGYISCPLHGVRFNLETGAPMGELTKVAVQTFTVVEEEGSIRISLADPD